MESANFDQSNIILGPPDGLTEDDVKTIHAFKGVRNLGDHKSTVHVVCYKPSREDMVRMERTGRLWVQVLGDNYPPISMSSMNPFEEPDKEESVDCDMGHPAACTVDGICGWCELVAQVRLIFVAVNSGDVELTNAAMKAAMTLV